MTYTNMFNEHDDSIELKKLKEEIEIHKKLFFEQVIEGHLDAIN